MGTPGRSNRYYPAFHEEAEGQRSDVHAPKCEACSAMQAKETGASPAATPTRWPPLIIFNNGTNRTQAFEHVQLFMIPG